MSYEDNRPRTSNIADPERPARYIVGFDRVFGEWIYSDAIFRVVPPKLDDTAEECRQKGPDGGW